VVGWSGRLFTQMGFCGWRWVRYPAGMDDPPPSTQWMARAAEATSLATRMRDPDARSTMLSIAAGYERLARRAEVTKAEAPVAEYLTTPVQADRGVVTMVGSSGVVSPD
jgi:hypothetical protein